MKTGSLLMSMMLMIAVGLSGCKKEKPKDVVLNAVPTVSNQLPALVITQTDNSKVIFKELTGKVLLVFFNPDCDHCQREAKMMSENKAVFSAYQVYFVTPDSMPAVVKFAQDYNLTEPNFHFGRAEGGDVFNAVGQINSVPAFFVYDNQTLVARNEGEVTIEKLNELLNN